VPAIVQRLADWWSAIYGNHTAVSVSVIFLHLAGLLVATSGALAADRRILGAVSTEDRERVLADLPATHRVVLGGLAAVVASGVLLTLSDLEFMLHEPVYYVKLTVVALLLANGWALRRFERGAAIGRPAGWARLRLTARLSGVFWFATVLVGVWLSKA